MNKYAFFAYWENVDLNMLETCIASLRQVSDCVIQIATDGIPSEAQQRLDSYGVWWIGVPREEVKKRRACCKIEVLYELMAQYKDDDMILVSDVDIVFIKDPFVPFDTHQEMDLGLTTRGYKHAFPINGGVFYVRVSTRMRKWLHWHLEEIYKPTWLPYVNHRKRWNHAHFGLDWSVGQDFLVANWKQKDWVKNEKDVNIVDAGPEYNYCPPTDTMGAKAFALAKKALEQRSVSVLHLKSELKKMIYQPDFPGAKINHVKGRRAWA
jgi:hypothetical protein